MKEREREPRVSEGVQKREKDESERERVLLSLFLTEGQFWGHRQSNSVGSVSRRAQ